MPQNEFMFSFDESGRGTIKIDDVDLSNVVSGVEISFDAGDRPLRPSVRLELVITELLQECEVADISLDYMSDEELVKCKQLIKSEMKERLDATD